MSPSHLPGWVGGLTSRGSQRLTTHTHTHTEIAAWERERERADSILCAKERSGSIAAAAIKPTNERNKIKIKLGPRISQCRIRNGEREKKGEKDFPVSIKNVVHPLVGRGEGRRRRREWENEETCFVFGSARDVNDAVTLAMWWRRPPNRRRWCTNERSDTTKEKKWLPNTQLSSYPPPPRLYPPKTKSFYSMKLKETKMFLLSDDAIEFKKKKKFPKKCYKILFFKFFKFFTKK
jgi:hypothetical protein